MDCQSILNSNFILNKKKRIGRVIYVVEGNKAEIRLLKKVFSEILDYSFVSENRTGDQMKFINKKDDYSVIYVFNSINSNISSIEDGDVIAEFVSEKIRAIYDQDFKINNAAIFYLFDRDYKSNDSEIVKSLIKKYSSSRESLEEYNMQGLLLLSYPSIESFICESLVKNYYKKDFGLGTKLKRFLSNRKKSIDQVDEANLIKGIKRSHNMMLHMGIKDYNIDDFSITNMKIFDYQESYLNENEGYRLISLLGLSLIDLGIIEMKKKVVLDGNK